MAGKEIEKLTKLIAKLPSLGTRSSRRIVLQLLKKRESLFLPLIELCRKWPPTSKPVKSAAIMILFRPVRFALPKNAKTPPSAWCRTLQTYGQWKGFLSLRENIMF